MNPELRELIAGLRAELEGGRPATLVWAQINAGAPADEIPAGLPRPVRELLAAADGILAGAFDLPAAAELPGIQYHLETMPGFTRIADEPQRWLVFGTLHEEPLLLDRETGAVWYFPDADGDEWFMRERFDNVASGLDEFVGHYVFGPGYGRIAFDDDEWWEFLSRHGLTEGDHDGGREA
ncbi:SUKH-4 family immunity protein [Actinoplanes teichomyceticus]|uniref:SUKH-4 immunity protein of toxin-antitoxin system n=1 Tax=Actinoplanes teichomyceticus TaxID=1867 RepID=A0A561WKG6_ACTTI|nr:SUKH-4 family immunity protein [Actinoplanes teichomyceticus]TWG24364.1 SUKH-4 immunity protein of toxin-antitoxin system [Actinoplanes teichomyceticus]GIF12784.1 hypothetical protein Ate01nite_28160 [Actinoplanes teichomyceticus]